MLSVQNINQNFNNAGSNLQRPLSNPAFGDREYYPYGSQNGGYYENNDTTDIGKTAITAGLLQLLSSSLNKASQWLSNRLTSGKEFAGADDVARVAGDMVKNNKLDVTIEYISPENLGEMTRKYGGGLEEVAHGKNAFFSPEKKLAVAPKSKPSLLPHELGHAINAKSRFWSAMQKSRRYTSMVPLAVLLLSKFKPDNSGEPNFVERNAGLLGFGAFLPTIIEEGKASLRGIKQAKKTLANEIKSGKIKLGALKRNYFVAWLTYLLAGVGLGVATKYSIVENNLYNGK